MRDFLRGIGEKLNIIFVWSFENHPGKLIGSISGLVLALLIIILGFLQTILLLFLTFSGFYIGKCWDDEALPSWLKKLLHRISFWSKN